MPGDWGLLSSRTRTVGFPGYCTGFRCFEDPGRFPMPVAVGSILTSEYWGFQATGRGLLLYFQYPVGYIERLARQSVGFYFAVRDDVIVHALYIALSTRSIYRCKGVYVPGRRREEC